MTQQQTSDIPNKAEPVLPHLPHLHPFPHGLCHHHLTPLNSIRSVMMKITPILYLNLFLFQLLEF